MQKRHRVFIAINLPEDVKKELVKYQEKWQELFRSISDRESSTKSGPAKWTRNDQLHITLEFLGDLTDQEVGEVCKVSKEVATRHKPFDINLEKILYGPPKKMPPRMVWAEGEKSDELKDLKEDLEECLVEEINFRPEGKGFVPHITMARIQEWEFRKIEPEERPEINEEINLEFLVESIEVMESELKRGGPAYTVLESCELKS